MNESHDRMEKELRSLRPHEVSHELRERIAAQLEPAMPAPANGERGGVSPPMNRHRGLNSTYALAGGLIAAGMAAALLVWLSRAPNVQPNQPDQANEPSHASALLAFDGALPSVWTFQKALTQSNSDLDALLDQHAEGGSKTEHDVVHAAVFTRTDAQLRTIFGEL